MYNKKIIFTSLNEHPDQDLEIVKILNIFFSYGTWQCARNSFATPFDLHNERNKVASGLSGKVAV